MVVMVVFQTSVWMIIINYVSKVECQVIQDGSIDSPLQPTGGQNQSAHNDFTDMSIFGKNFKVDAGEALHSVKPPDHITLAPNSQYSSVLNNLHRVSACHQSAECVPLEEQTCLGVKLPYTHTSLVLTGFKSQAKAREQLEVWKALQNIPRCWAVVQPFLCSVLFPPCHNSSVELPSQEMCNITRVPCRLVELERKWPDFLQCKQIYQPTYLCRNSVRELKFNTSGRCAAPLVETEEEDSWYEGVKGCGIQCSNPMFTEEEHQDLRRYIGIVGGISLAFVALTVITYLIDWKSASKYPALIIFYINGCLLVASIGFMVQFQAGAREDITCRKDGTLRQAEPSSGENLSCVAVFICIYYFMIACGMWVIVLTYCWHTSFKSLAAGESHEELERRAAYFHLIAWSLPLVLTITLMALAEVRADSMAGICFLSTGVHIRVGFLIVPVVLIICTSGYFLIQSLITLVKFKMECSNIIGEKANSKIVETIVRMGIFTIALVTFTAVTVYCHIYNYNNQHHWDAALRSYIMCVSNITVHDGRAGDGRTSCSLSTRPSLNLYKLHFLAFFGVGIIMSSWCWTPNSVDAWKRFIRRVAGISSDEPVRLAKHRVIAHAYAKRNDLNTVGRLSISLHSLHDDPLGLNFDMNSGTSGDLSSAWAAAIPHLMTRRGALVGSAALGLRRNSVDSDYSISRRFSFESGCNRGGSRRHSLDSQMSFHLSDAERLAALQTAARFGRRKRRDWFSMKRARRITPYDRRGSNTSDDSNMGSMILPAITVNNQDTLFTNMMKRLNLSSDEPTRSERAGPAGPPSKNSNLNVTLPGQNMESEDEAGVGNGGYIEEDSIAHTVLNNVLKSTDLKRQDGTYVRSGRAQEDGLALALSKSGITRRNLACAEVATQTKMVSVGIQTYLEPIFPRNVETVEKSVQVSSPQLRRASHRFTQSPASSKNSLFNTNRSVNNRMEETSFVTKLNTKHSPSDLRMSQNNSLKAFKKNRTVIEKTNDNNQSLNKTNHSSRGSMKDGQTHTGHTRSVGDVITVLDMDEGSGYESF
ncbi:smoothened, frizzled class receptor isoform X2 [Oratosquilla oratoria]|uniref:smoothened, frizzled class receptor isoform X2 n=1 Tax=Oratosquilla oratoria TaxID=337810 RepID=UPI003F767B4B